ncbi:MAG: helix-turn-helix domain-containing protein [Opitutaceae bacterium]|nr:helix-turn-helix domain-containing protein [Opitutaceae bacterium]
MKSAKTEVAATTGNRTKLNLFGKFLKTAREKTIPTQHEAAHFLTEAGHAASQSLIAQLETGRISNPDAALLKKLAEVYKVSYKDLINCLSLDKYGVNDDETSQLCQDLVAGNLSAQAAEDPVAAHRRRSKLTFFKHADVLDVDGMAEWQKTFPNLKNYWVIAPDFVDDRVASIRDAVIHNLQRGVNITYFVKEGEEKVGGRFHRFKRKLEASMQRTAGMKDIRAVPVPLENLRWLAADMVIANPDFDLLAHPEGGSAVGYLVVRSDGSPAFGLRMSTADVEKTVDLIYPYAAEKGGDSVVFIDQAPPAEAATAKKRKSAIS